MTNVIINKDTVKEGKEEVINTLTQINWGNVGKVRNIIVTGFESDREPKKVAKDILKYFKGLDEESLKQEIERCKTNIVSKSPEVKENYIDKVMSRVVNALNGKDSDKVSETVVEKKEVIIEETKKEVVVEEKESDLDHKKILKAVNDKKMEEIKAEKEKEVEVEATVTEYVTTSNTNVKDSFAERTGISTFFSNLAFKIKTW